MTASPTTPRALRVVDIAVGAVIAVAGLLLGFGLLVFLSSLSPVAEQCVDTGCDTTGLNVALIAGAAVVVFGWAITFGLYLVRAIRRRISFFWPLIGLVVMVAATYGTTAAVAAWIESAGILP